MSAPCSPFFIIRNGTPLSLRIFFAHRARLSSPASSLASESFIMAAFVRFISFMTELRFVFIQKSIVSHMENLARPNFSSSARF